MEHICPEREKSPQEATQRGIFEHFGGQGSRCVCAGLWALVPRPSGGPRGGIILRQNKRFSVYSGKMSKIYEDFPALAFLGVVKLHFIRDSSVLLVLSCSHGNVKLHFYMGSLKTSGIVLVAAAT